LVFSELAGQTPVEVIRSDATALILVWGTISAGLLAWLGAWLGRGK